jgi:Protein of unknown function (DUF1360)
MIVFLCGLAVARATRLYRDDTLTEGLRTRVQSRLMVYDGHWDQTNPFDPKWVVREAPYLRRERLKGWLDDLLDCSWCLSGWLAAAAIIFIDSATSRSIDLPVLAWLATWWVACAAYWLAEVLFDADSVIYHERTQRGVGD